jgi:hypothetical protein
VKNDCFLRDAVETANAAAGLLGSMTGMDIVEVVDVCLCYSADSQVPTFLVKINTREMCTFFAYVQIEMCVCLCAQALTSSST